MFAGPIYAKPDLDSTVRIGQKLFISRPWQGALVSRLHPVETAHNTCSAYFPESCMRSDLKKESAVVAESELPGAALPSRAPKREDPLAPLKAEYHRAIEALSYCKEVSFYTPAGRLDGDLEARVAHLLDYLGEQGTAEITAINDGLQKYCEGMPRAEGVSRYEIGHQDPTLLEFIQVSRQLEAAMSYCLLDGDGQRGTGPASPVNGRRSAVCSPPTFDAEVESTAKKWLELAESVLKLDKQAEERGIDLDWAEHDADERARLDAALDASAGAQEPRDLGPKHEAEYDPTDPDDPRNDPEWHGGEEDVANWPGRTGGNWT